MALALPGRVTFLDEIRRYVDFDGDDSRALAAFLPVAEPHIERISARFYDRIRRHPGAHAAITGGDAQIERLKRTLAEWMRTGLQGPHDEAYHDRRCRIGRMHVRIQLPQRYMLTAMNRIRLDFAAVADDAYAGDPEARIRTQRALHKLFDVELAIMLETYRESSDDLLRRTERLATIGKLAGTVAHDLRNPLGVIESSLYLLDKRAGDDPRLQRHLQRIGAQVATCSKIINSLLEMARTARARRDPLDLARVFEDAVAGARVPPQVRVSVTVDDGLDARGDAGLLTQAVTNLIGNAVGAYDGAAGRVLVSARRAEPSGIAIEVADEGPGFDPEILACAFEPLVTTRHHGVGLGLALVKAIADRHGGRVEAANRDRGGAVVRLSLPAPAAEDIQ